jgi:uncharacterized glyoxalase superfamily protein PhnB
VVATPRTDCAPATELGAATGGVYVVLDSPAAVDAHHMVAETAGATIVMAPQDMDYGSREYDALDLEGHLWSFGTYRLGGETETSGDD